MKMENALKWMSEATTAEKSCYDTVYCLSLFLFILLPCTLASACVTVAPFDVVIFHFHGKIVKVVKEPGFHCIVSPA